MSKEPSISSREASEKVSPGAFGGDMELDSSQIDVAAQIAIGGYGETISEEQAHKLKYV